MREALAEAVRGMAEGEAPIGCVLARGQDETLRIVARGHNRVNALARKTACAEMVAFKKRRCLALRPLPTATRGACLPPEARKTACRTLLAASWPAKAALCLPDSLSAGRKRSRRSLSPSGLP